MLVRFDVRVQLPIQGPSKTWYLLGVTKDFRLCFECISEQLITGLNVDVFANLRIR